MGDVSGNGVIETAPTCKAPPVTQGAFSRVRALTPARPSHQGQVRVLSPGSAPPPPPPPIAVPITGWVLAVLLIG